MTSHLDDEPPWGTLTGHRQAIAVLGDRKVTVDEPLVPLIETFHRCGITTNFSCRDVPPPHGSWRDDPGKPRFYVVFPDADELRKLLPLLAHSEELVRSIRRCLGSTRWEFVVSVQGIGGEPWPISQDVRLQVAAFIPFEQLDTLVAALAKASFKG